MAKLQGKLSGFWEEITNLTIPFHCIRLNNLLSEERDLIFSGVDENVERYDVLRQTVEPIDNPPTNDDTGIDDIEEESVKIETKVIIEEPAKQKIAKFAVEFLFNVWNLP